MKVLPAAPYQLIPGEPLSPRSLTSNFRYIEDTIDSVHSARFSNGVINYTWTDPTVAALTQASAASRMLFTFRCPDTAVIERIFFSGVLTGTVTAQISGTGITTTILPVLTSATDGAGNLIYAIQAINDSISVAPGVFFNIQLLSTTAFSTSNLSMTIHTKTDRWNTAGAIIPHDYSSITFDDGDDYSYAVIRDEFAIVDPIADLGATNRRAVVPAIFAVHDFTSATQQSFKIPALDSFKGSGEIVSVSVSASCDIAGPVITFQLLAPGFVPVLTQAVTASAVGLNTISSTTSVSLKTPVANAWSLTANDFILTVTNSSATNCVRAYIILWITRS